MKPFLCIQRMHSLGFFILLLFCLHRRLIFDNRNKDGIEEDDVSDNAA